MGGRGGGSGSLSRSLGREENAIRGGRTEVVVVVDSRGNVLFRHGEGKEQEVGGFSREQLNMMRDAIITHNHPHGYYLSKEDICTMLSVGAREIRATTPDGRAFSLKRTEPLDIYGKHGQFYENYQRAIYETSSGVANEIMRRPDFPNMSHSEFNHQCMLLHTRYINQWLENNASRYGMAFKEEGKRK